MILAHSTDRATASEEIPFGVGTVGFADEPPAETLVGDCPRSSDADYLESTSEMMFLQNAMVAARRRVLEAAVGASECLIYREHALNQFGFKSSYKLFLIYERPDAHGNKCYMGKGADMELAIAALLNDAAARIAMERAMEELEHAAETDYGPRSA